MVGLHCASLTYVQRVLLEEFRFRIDPPLNYL
jgi:hypothetical protein